MAKPGTVFLVGAGPGDPGLLTQRAVELMHHCDVVCYDLLVSDAILSQIPHGKEIMPVGYRGYCGTSIEYGMHPDVVEQALMGKSVLRLKAGDPFIFGRGTEECLCLQHYGIDYQVIPGISASLGAAAYSGFPLTSNGMASDVTFASGHRASTTISNWAALGQGSGTLVLYMGAKKLTQHAAELINQGKSPDTPLAVISAATSARHRLLSTTLSQAGAQIAEFDNGDPMLVVIGEVVTLADTLDWRNKLPLSGVQVIAATANRNLLAQLKLAGAVVVEPLQLSQQVELSEPLWQQLLQQTELHLADLTAAQGLLAQCRARRFDLRQWPWQFSGCDAALELMAAQGLYGDDVQIAGSFELSAGTEGMQVATEVSGPSYPLSKSPLLVIDDVASLDYLAGCQALAANAVVISQDAAVLERAQVLGLTARTLGDNGDCDLTLAA